MNDKIYKHMTAVSKNVYIDELDEIVDKYSNIYHKTIKMKPGKVKADTYIEYGVEHNDRDAELKVGHNVRISKYKNIFA